MRSDFVARGWWAKWPLIGGHVLLITSLATSQVVYGQSADPFQSVRPAEPPADATRSAPASQQGLRVAPPPSGAARGFDGTWQGTITCEPLGRAGRSNIALTLTVANGSARYEKRALTPEGVWLGAYERGWGSVSADGSVTLNGQMPGQGSAAESSAQASYRGRADGNTMNLNGHQLWTNSRTGNSTPRPCRIALTRS